MNELFFWNHWERSYRLGFKFLIAAGLLLMATALYFVIADQSLVFEWIATVYLEYKPLTIAGQKSEHIESLVTTDLPIIFQRFSAQYMPLNIWIAYGYAIIFYMSLVGCITVTTYLQRFYYIGSMGLFMLIIAFGGFSKLTVFGLENEFGIALIALPFVALAYYFNSVKTQISWGIRYMSFLGLATFFAVLIKIGSVYEQPFLILSYHVFMPSMILAVVFIFLVSQEIILAILTLTTKDSSEKSSHNTKHFIVLSVVYLANVALLYFRNSGYLDWDIYYINEVLLLTISTILGLWGLKQREILYGNILEFRPNVAILYGLLLIICFATITFQTMVANDPALEAIEDAIVFGHLGFGGMFFLYIILNFISLLIKNLPVHKVAFKEDNFPYITARIGGLLAVAAFFFVSNKAALHQSVAAFYNGLGDVEMIRANRAGAKFYYNEGYVYSQTNHKSNFMLANMNEKSSPRLRHLKNAKGKNPTPGTYVNLGREYEQNNQFFDAIFTYQEGLQKFPGNEQIGNNLALLYNKTNVADSALYYTNVSGGGDWIEMVRATNRAGIGATHDYSIDDIYEHSVIAKIERPDVYSNLLASAMSTKDTGFDKVMQSTSTQLNLITSSYLINWGLWSFFNDDISFLNSVDAYLLDDRNGEYIHPLKFVKALNLYHQGYVTKAFELIDELLVKSEDESGIFEMLLGKWCMQHGAYQQAAKLFERSRENGYPDATLDLAKAYVLLDNASVGQFIVRKQLETETDPVRIDQINQLLAQFVNGKLQVVLKDLSINQVYLNELVNSPEADEDEIFELAIRNPFFEQGVITGAAYFNEKVKKQDKAYELLVKGVAINGYSENLNKIYINQCLKMGLINYAESSVEKLSEIMAPEAYDAYLVEFERNKTELEASLENW